jgi:hypothetical protein
MRIEERELLENGEQRRSVKLLPAELVKEAARFLVKFRRTAVTRAKLAQVQKWLKDNGPTSNLAHCRGAGKTNDPFLFSLNLCTQVLCLCFTASNEVGKVAS